MNKDRPMKTFQKPPANDTAPELIRISARLANIEALLRQLLERRQAAGRCATRRVASLHERLRTEADKGPPLTEQDMEIARRFLAK